MSGFAKHETIENVRRLALGFAPIDSIRQRELTYPVRVDIERVLPHRPQLPENRYCFPQHINLPPRTLCRHFSGRYALLYYPSLQQQIQLRIYYYDRYYVPRLLRVPLLTEAAVEAIEEAEDKDFYVDRVDDRIISWCEI